MTFYRDLFVFYKNQGYNEIAIGKPIALVGSERR